MLKCFVILFFSFFLCVLPVKAHDFNEISVLWDVLFSNFDGEINFKNVSLHGGKALSEVDETVRLYNSDSKAFLYKKNNLIATFKFPQNSDSHAWKQLLIDIIQTGITHSDKLSNNPKMIGNKVIAGIMENLDPYSRVQADATSHNKQMTYKFIKNVLYVHPAEFYKGCSDYLKKVILSHPAIEGVVLDLRDNRGGDFNEALKTADLFLDSTLIGYRKSKNSANRYYVSNAGDILTGRPIIVLTNEHTASSAEVVTAALQEQSRATLIGTKTYGKNSTQLSYTHDEQKIFITNGAFYTPSGKQINQTGILPKICTGLNNSCIYSDKNQRNKDIYTAIRLIKENLG